jgi:cytochrome c553
MRDSHFPSFSNLELSPEPCFNQPRAKLLSEGAMTKFLRVLVLVLLVAVATVAQAPQQQQTAPGPSWAFAVPDQNIPATPDNGAPIKVPGSDKTYTQKQIDDLFNPPDWFPNEHGPLPQVVAHGSGTMVRACGACHLMSGLGHPESADLAGLPAAYLERQMAAFKDGTRKNGASMVAIGMAATPDESRQASEFFASLKPMPWVKVVEADTVPKTFVNAGRMRLPLPGGAAEPIGNRIIEVPVDVARTLSRDPHSGTIAYVPPGSLAKGQALVTSGAGKTTQCDACHGETLTGMAEIPRIAGLSPLYIARQLYNFKAGAAPGSWAELMKGVVKDLSDDDIVNISAYVASRPVPTTSPVTQTTAPAASQTSTAPAAPAAGGDAALVARGKVLFTNYRCFDCHGMNGEGTDDAPDLIGTKLDGDGISKFIQNPSADASVKGMPDIPASSPDLAPIVAYVLTLKRSK